MRLIDADDLYTVCKEVAENDCLTDGAAVEVLDIVCEAMANTKTIDAVEIVHGHWVRIGMYDHCSRCDEQYDYGSQNYCGNCGAKMDEVSECGTQYSLF